MTAVIEAAVSRQLLYVGKLLAERRFISPHVDFANTRIVDDDPATPEHHEFTGRGGVPSLACDFVDLVGPLVFTAQQVIDHRGFSRPAGAYKGDGNARL